MSVGPQITEFSEYCQLNGTSTGVASIANLICRLSELARPIGPILLPREVVEQSCAYLKWDENREEHIEKMGHVSKTQDPVHAGLLELATKTLDENSAAVICAVLGATDEWLGRVARGESDRKMYETSVYGVWLAMRKLSPNQLGAIADSSLKKVYENALQLLERPQTGLEQKPYLEHIERFFARFLGIRERTAVRNAGNAQLPNHDVHKQILLEPDPKSELDSPDIDVWVHDQALDQVRNTIDYRQGNSAREIQSVGVYFRERRPLASALGESHRSRAPRFRSNIAHVRRNAQVLPGRWGLLTDDEIFQLLPSKVNPVLMELGLMRLIILLTGRPYEHVARAKLVECVEKVPKKIGPDDIYFVLRDRAWLSGVIEPDDRRKRTPAWAPVLELHTDHLLLPIPDVIWEALKSPFYCCRKRVSGSRSSIHLFDTDSEIIDLLSSEIALSASERARGITRSRIEHQLYSEILAITGDSAEASLITGRQPPYGTSASLFYHCCTREHLVAVYSKIVDRWQALVVKAQPKMCERQQSLFDGRVGSNLALTTAAIQALIRDFQNDVDRWRGAIGQTGALIGFHNAYTSYVLLTVLFLTGYRAVRDILECRSDYDEVAGTLVIADKTADDLGHVRMVPVCKTLGKQLLAYEHHSRIVRSRLTRLGAESPAGFLFYLSDDCDLERVTPKNIAKKFSWAYGLHLNSNRHYLRGALRDRGIAGGYVDAFMGHWGVGREPTGRYSAFDTYHFIAEVGNALEGIAIELGLTVMEGYWSA